LDLQPPRISNLTFLIAKQFVSRNSPMDKIFIDFKARRVLNPPICKTQIPPSPYLYFSGCGSGFEFK
jgi:hypothetical protein